MFDEEIASRYAYKWALKNALDHDGKAMEGPVIAKVIAEYQEVKRDISRLKAIVEVVVDRVNSMTIQEIEQALSEVEPGLLKRKGEEQRRGLPPLPGAVKGSVVTRLPPEPSGYMHVGHALSGLINYLYKELYDGRLWLRFEDTDPRKVLPEYYESFREGYRWLGIKWDYEKSNSDDMQIYYEFAAKLIEDGHAYVCTCRQEEMRERRSRGEPCVHREMTPDWSMEGWEKMLGGSFAEGEATLRLKGDISSSNTALRDPVLFRIIDAEHPLKRDRYRVWPTYDFAVSVEDAICGVTHVLRTSEFRLRDELQNLIRSYLGFSNPFFVEYSRFEFEGTPLAKRELRRLIESGVITGWDDPRLATVTAIRRRGITPEALREFVFKYTALTTTRKVYSWELINSINRRVLDPSAPRLFFAPNPVRLMIRNMEREAVEIPFHPSTEMGSRRVEVKGEVYIAGDDAASLSHGSLVRLKYLCNVRIVERRGEALVGVAEPGGPEQNVQIIQWVPKGRERRIRVLVPGPLIDNNGELLPDSLKSVFGVVEEAVDKISVGAHVQFERFGYCIKDREPYTFVFTHR